MAVLPTRILEVEFTAGTWTDVTADLVSFASRRGRNRESGAYETGTLAFTLRNDARKYDPDHAAGPYYGRLRPNRRVRLRATYNAVTYPIFQGYVDRISQIGGGPNDAVAVFQASDLFKVLNRVELPVSVYSTVVAADAPAAWYRLDEPDSATAALDATTGARHLDVVGAVNFGETGLVVRDPGTAVALPGTVTDTISRQVPAVFTGPPLSMELWYRRTTASTDGALIGQFAGSQGSVWLTTATTGILVFVIINGAGTSTTATSTGHTLNDMAAHHIVVTWAADGAMKIYVDGVDRTNGAPTLAATPFTASTAHVFVGGTPPGLVEDSDVGIWQHAAFYTTALTLTQAQTHNTAGRTPWTGDLPGPRLTRILDLAGVPVADRTIGAGTTTLQSSSLGGSALGYAQKIEETEAGRLFVARDGKITFVGRRDADLGAYLTPKFTVVDDDSGAGVPYRAANAEVDESVIVTRATVSRDGSVAVTYSDAAAQLEFGWLDETHDGLLHDSDAYSLAYAQWIVSTHKTPSSRVGSVPIVPAKDPAVMWPALLGLELAERVTYKRKPQNVGVVTTTDMRAEAVSHALVGQEWVVELQLSPFYLAGGVPTGIWDTSLWDQAVWGL